MAFTIPTPLRVMRVGDNLVVAIPAEICAQFGIDADRLLRVTIEPVEMGPKLRPALERNAERLFVENHAALEYLTEN